MILRKRDPARPRPFRVPAGTPWTVGLYAAYAIGVLFFRLPLGWTAALLAGGAVVFWLGRKQIIPVLGAISCVYLIYYLPPTSWLRFAAWLNFGFVLYVVYGSAHSRLTGRAVATNRADHDGITAWHGTLLGWLGVAMLLVTHALDVWIHARRAGAGATSVATVDAWLQPSAFLLVPLALVVLVLCPVVLLRARAAHAATPAVRSLATRAAALTWTLVVAAVGYGAAILLHA